MRIFSSLSKLLAVPVLLLAVQIPVQAATLHIQHAQGVTEVKQNPQTVAVLDWSTLDTLAQLGIEAQGIPGSSSVPDMLQQYADSKFVHIGSLFEPDYAAIEQLEPDLIILGRRAAAHYQDVAKYAPTLDLTPSPDDVLGSVIRNTEQLGEIFQRQAEASRVIQDLQQSVEKLQALTASQGTGLLLLTTAGKVAAPARDSRFGLIYNLFGLQMAGREQIEARKEPALSYELLAEVNPDWLFVMDRDAAVGRDGVSARQLMEHELIAGTTAGRQQQIVYLEPQAWYLLDSSGAGVLQSNINQLLEVFAANKAQ